MIVVCKPRRKRLGYRKICFQRPAMHPGPSGADGVGDRYAHAQSTLGERADHLLGQPRLAAKQMRQTRDIQEQTIRARRIVDPYDRAEPLAPLGELFQSQTIGFWIGGFEMWFK